jgi:hypothetical protein
VVHRLKCKSRYFMKVQKKKALQGVLFL